MSGKYKYLYLYLALVCLLGIILIFVFDGYMGIYDTLTIKSGEMPQKIEADQWSQRGRTEFIPSTSVVVGGKVDFTYEIINHGFSSYQPDIAVSVWRNQVKVADLQSTRINIKAFDKGQVNWSFDAAQFFTGNLTTSESVEFTMVIQREDVQRKVIVYIYSGVIPPEKFPVP